jgi:hypothetical protein
MLILYGTAQHRQKLLAFLRLPRSQDPLFKAGGLCEVLLGLSSANEGGGLPVGYPKEQFPLELAVGCLDYTEEVGTIVSAPGGTAQSEMGERHGTTQEGSITITNVSGIYAERGCDYGAQTVQNITSRDFGHRVSDPITLRDKAITAIKKWWIESRPATSSPLKPKDNESSKIVR